MLRRTFVFVPAAAFIFTGCSNPRRPQSEVFAAYLGILARATPTLKALPLWDQPPYFETDEADPQRRAFRLVVSAQTAVDGLREWKDARSLRQVLPGVHPSAVESFVRRNAEPSEVRLAASHLPPELTVDLVSPSLIERAFGVDKDVHQRWAKFYDSYPGAQGIARFSAAGTSSDGQQAAFVFERRCGALCGTGHAVLMRRMNGQWAVEDHRSLWVS